MKLHVLAIILSFVFSAAYCSSATKLSIASGGKTSYTILIPTNPTVTERNAANQLSDYLQKITKAKFSVSSETSSISGPAFYVGWTDKAASKGLDGSKMDTEEWLIKTSGRDIILTGGHPTGVLYAVYHFLEDHAGVRWWNVSEELVPNKPLLSIPAISRRAKPAFEKRDICLDGGAGEYSIRDQGLWASRNRLNAIGISPISLENGYNSGRTNWPLPWVAHTLTEYIFKPDLAASEPELFAWNGTTRLNNKLCLTNPEVSKRTAQWYDEYISTQNKKAELSNMPKPLLFNVSEADSASLACWEPNCIKVRETEGSEAGMLIGMLNTVAGEIGKKYPDVILETLAYWNTDTAPNTLRPADNVAVRLCDVEALLTHPLIDPLNKKFADKVKAWGKITQHLHIWDYNMSYRVEEPPLAMEFCLQPDYKYFRSCGVKQIMAEMEDSGMLSSDNWHMRAWFMSKLMENPDRDTRQLLYDYTNGYYGPAGKYIREYRYLTYAAAQAKPPYTTQLCNENAQSYRYITIDFMKKARTLLDKASAAVKNNSTYSRRVDIARLPYDRTILRYYTFLLRDWVDSGNPAATFPFNRNTAATKIQRTAKEFADFYLVPEKRADAAKTYDTMITTALAYNNNWPLPEFAKNLPTGYVHELTAQGLGTFLPQLSVAPDRLGPCGVSVKFTGAPTAGKDNVVPAGIWRSWDYNAIRTTDLPALTKAQIKGSGYNWYRLAEGWDMQRGDKIFLMNWGVQAMIDHVMPAVDNGGNWDIWVNVKFTGPAYLEGSQEADAVYIDRLILVRKS